MCHPNDEPPTDMPPPWKVPTPTDVPPHWHATPHCTVHGDGNGSSKVPWPFGPNLSSTSACRSHRPVGCMTFHNRQDLKKGHSAASNPPCLVWCESLTFHLWCKLLESCPYSWRECFLVRRHGHIFLGMGELVIFRCPHMGGEGECSWTLKISCCQQVLFSYVLAFFLWPCAILGRTMEEIWFAISCW